MFLGVIVIAIAQMTNSRKYLACPRVKVCSLWVFNAAASGYRCFDPETRQYFSTDNVYFYESFVHRIDALRHHDSRRELMRQGKSQPLIIDDFDDENAVAVRNLYLSPDAPEPGVPELSIAAPLPVKAPAQGKSPLQLPVDEVPLGFDIKRTGGPLSDRSAAAERSREIIRSAALLRPLRLLVVGVEQEWTAEDKAFLAHIEVIGAPLAFQLNCPKLGKSLSALCYMLDVLCSMLAGLCSLLSDLFTL